MARPIKSGIDYFPLDCDWDDKVEKYLLETEAIGLAVLITIWQLIYKNGYFIQYDDDLLLLIKKRINVAIDDIRGCIYVAVRRDIFDKNLFDNHKILTSKAIQKRFFEAAKKKKVIQIVKDYLLCDVSELDNIFFIDGNNPSYFRNNPDNSGNNDIKLKLKEKLNKKFKVNETEVIAAETPNFQTSNSQTFFTNSNQTENENTNEALPLPFSKSDFEPSEYTEKSCTDAVIRMLNVLCNIPNPGKSEIKSFVNIILNTPNVKKSTAFGYVFEVFSEFLGYEEAKRNLSYAYKRIKGRINDALIRAREERAKMLKQQEKPQISTLIIPEISDLVNKMKIS